jgi:hypothetical protein
MDKPHLAPLPGTDWQVWRWALLRSAGFPADGLDRFSAAECARAADAYLAGDDPGQEGFDRAFEAAITETAKAVHDVAADPRFRMAVLWQNPDASVAIDGILRAGPQAPRNSRYRSREEIIAKYWQRYCAKNDTVGFFGPMCWVTLDPDARPMTGGPGPLLVRRSAVFFERWALEAVADWLAADPLIRRWLPIGLQPHLTVAGHSLIYPQRVPVQLSPAEVTLLECCDGRAAAVIAGRLADDPGSGFRAEADVFALIEQLVSRGVLRHAADLPMDLTAEQALRRHLAGIGNPAVRQRATAALDRLCGLRDALADTADPDELADAIARLDAEFTALTGRPPRQRAGQTQAGRTLCHLETVRDCELTFGGILLDKLTPLEPLLVSARWLSAALAQAYQAMLADLYREAADEVGREQVPLAQFWYSAFDAFVGRDRPADPVVAEYLRRWATVLGLDRVGTGTKRLELTTRELMAKVARTFSAVAPGWATARFHSPDLHICAPSAGAVERGEFTVVLGELHVSLAAFDTHFFMTGHPAPGELVEAMSRDIPVSRVALAIPDDWPRTTAREAEWLAGPADIQLGFTVASGMDRERLLPITALTVTAEAGNLIVRAPDGRSWPLIETFAGLLWMHAFDTWKLAGTGAHTPRIIVDGLVLVRETWRTTVAETGLSGITGERERYLAIRRWRQALGLPERIFMRIDTETKPCYFDLTSPLYARILCNMLGAAHRRGGAGTALAISEMLPGPDEAWLTDASGQRYTSELRAQIRDPLSSVASQCRGAPG